MGTVKVIIIMIIIIISSSSSIVGLTLIIRWIDNSQLVFLLNI